MYHHMNNSVYYFLYDSIVNAYLIKHSSLDTAKSSQIGFIAHSSSQYFAPVGFPALLDLGLRVTKLGKSSVTYEIGLFERGVEEVKAVGTLVHVFVDRENNRPAAGGMNIELRDGLQNLVPKMKGKL